MALLGEGRFLKVSWNCCLLPNSTRSCGIKPSDGNTLLEVFHAILLVEHLCNSDTLKLKGFPLIIKTWENGKCEVLMIIELLNWIKYNRERFFSFFPFS